MGNDDSAIKSINLKPGTHYVSNLEPRSCFLTSGLWTGSPLRSLRLCVRRGLGCVFGNACNSAKRWNWGQDFPEKIKVRISSLGNNVP